MKPRIAFLAIGFVCLGAAPAVSQPPPPSAFLTTSGDDSEVVQTIPIKRRGPFIPVLEMDSEAMPDLAEGDGLIVSAELLVTTDCVSQLPRCAGQPYVFSPRVEARLVLVSGEAKARVASESMSCRQKPSDRQHHCLLTFMADQAGGDADALGCSRGGCTLRVEARATHREATGAERLVIGSQASDGTIVQDKGRVNAIRLRPETAQLAVNTAERVGNFGVKPDLHKRVAASIRLNRLQAGEQLNVRLLARGSVGHLPYPALIGSQLVLAETPKRANPGHIVRRAVALDGEITELSGSNCTQKQTPCPIARTGVITVKRTPLDASGSPKPLYVNFVVRANEKRATGGRSDRVLIRDAGGLSVDRYPPADAR